MAGGFTRTDLGSSHIEIEPLHVPSLKESCISRLEGLILSGEWRMDERLPSERELANQLCISRPVLHDSLVDLASKGLVTISPRRGVFINDYRTNGSLAILASLLVYHSGKLAPEMTQSLMDMRGLLETENARLAALHHTKEQLAELDIILEQELDKRINDVNRRVELDFQFHLLIAVASGNLIYPLIINSFKKVYTSLTGLFFSKYQNSHVASEVLDFHHNLVEAIRNADSQNAGEVMQAMLIHGEGHLKGES